MTKKKGILGKLFGGSSGGCSCGMEIAEEKGGCNMQIVEETEPEQCCCCGDEVSADKES